MCVTLKPFSIGRIRIDFPVVLAGMAGYTDLAYRLICRSCGTDYCTSEMMLDKSILASRKLRNRLAAISDEDHPVAGQIIGNDPQTISAAAVALEEIGFDAIDLNFACPVNKARKRKRGGFLMSQPDLAIQITKAVTASVDRPVVLKLRRSFLTGDCGDAFWRISEGAFDAGVAAIAVHARSVEAKYTGSADWDFLAEVKRHFPDRTILGSGDIFTPADALDVLTRTKLDAILVARGALGNPWFFRQTRDLAAGRDPHQPTLLEQREVLIKHFDAACELHGPIRGPKTMRKFGIKYARMHTRPRDLRIAFVAVKTPKDWYAVVDEFYG